MSSMSKTTPAAIRLTSSIFYNAEKLDAELLVLLDRGSMNTGAESASRVPRVAMTVTDMLVLDVGKGSHVLDFDVSAALDTAR